MAEAALTRWRDCDARIHAARQRHAARCGPPQQECILSHPPPPGQAPSAAAVLPAVAATPKSAAAAAAQHGCARAPSEWSDDDTAAVIHACCAVTRDDALAIVHPRARPGHRGAKKPGTGHITGLNNIGAGLPTGLRHRRALGGLHRGTEAAAVSASRTLCGMRSNVAAGDVGAGTVTARTGEAKGLQPGGGAEGVPGVRGVSGGRTDGSERALNEGAVREQCKDGEKQEAQRARRKSAFGSWVPDTVACSGGVEPVRAVCLAGACAACMHITHVRRLQRHTTSMQPPPHMFPQRAIEITVMGLTI